MGMGGNVEYAGLSTVGVADKGHVDGLGSFLGDMVQCIAVGGLDGDVVLVVDYLPLCLCLANNLNLVGISPTQRHLEIHYTIFYRVSQRSVQHSFHCHALYKAHLDYSFSESAMTRHTNHDSTLSCL